ncbi:MULTISPECIES: SDR family oxidoreductase [Ralstonia]|jgi:3-oxoacyl-[acyl-carrier protein] reductase|uniref:Dehydrogenase n=1 Tax=Ralstonia pickettii OR214 TaxID=1264675 RepID=R0EAD6_RALPI|nr:MULTISPECIES: SDR family oxidoreductase [Ralstonia]ENZ79069.1 dehydrogenase of unknown specificity, short-chain alcohol dehydrogenase [Ralstonia pickettii OR214]MBL4778693.1 SDR family oxidoreductase [Ralstonia sp.]MCM3580655.1 SDR family oxidoreductase [Ralstonia pickettii]MDR9385700.1 SDR family oxidoreductase [Ralstonia sp. 11b]OYU22920.1 MAG: short-chain dehydrogenase [Ralstonia sp. PBBBR1]
MVSTAPVAFVTNACGYAGLPAVEALIAAGFNVFVHNTSFPESDPWAGSAGGQRVRRLTGDAATAFETTWAETGRIDALVSNDHHPAIHHAKETAPIGALGETLDALVVRAFALLQSAIPHLESQGGANIVMITSCRTRSPMPGGAIPDMARAAADALVRSLVIELAPNDIAVNAIAPNFLYSEAYYPKARFVDDADGREFVRCSVPAGRLGRPDEIGELITFLATIKARFMTGAIIDFSGGWPASPPRP